MADGRSLPFNHHDAREGLTESELSKVRKHGHRNNMECTHSILNLLTQ